jgi:hypothetical protein
LFLFSPEVPFVAPSRENGHLPVTVRVGKRRDS